MKNYHHKQMLTKSHRHRMPQDHQCIIEERKKQRREHMRTVTEKGKYNNALQSAVAKQNPTALKVAMMKMKLHSEVHSLELQP
jgi:hypothetical protein